MAGVKVSLLEGESERSGPARARWPVLAMGFRPFFALASMYGVVAMVWWGLSLQGAVRSPGGMPGTTWHAHEMLFGYGMAVVAGFLLTAVRNWTNRDTAHGWLLGALAVSWIAGRVVMAHGDALPGWLVVAIAMAFPVALPAVVGRVLVAARNRRNYVMIVVLSALATASLLVLLEGIGVLSGVSRPALHAGVHGIVLLNVVIGGRVIPMFTRNATGAEGIRSDERVDRVALVSSGLLVVGSVLPFVPAPVLGGVALVAGVSNLVRQRGWGWRAALGFPMLWVLHAGYLCIGLGQLALGAVWTTGMGSASSVLHVLTVGVIGTMTLGMMTRVSLGHTGRPIEAPSGMAWAFVAMLAAMVVRLSAGWLSTTAWQHAMLLSSLLFAGSLGVFVLRVMPLLFRPRPDGRPG